MPHRTRQWVVAKPTTADTITLEQFEMREMQLPDLEPGEALVRVKLINIHANTRQRMVREMVAPGQTDPTNYACAQVVQSRDPEFREGDIIACQAGWQEFQVVSSADGPVGQGRTSELVKALNRTNSPWTYVFRPAMVKMWSPDILMDVFGSSGMTAYFGLRECGPLTPRDAVLVSGVTGSVGSIAAQLARIAGCHVVGLAGGPDRCAWATETLGIDGCVDYLDPQLEARLPEQFPDGIDVYSDGAGGGLTETVVSQMNRHGRMHSYGSTAAFYAKTLEAPKPQSLRRTFGLSDTVEVILRHRHIKSTAGVVSEFYHERLKAEDDLSRLMLSGALKPVSKVVDGFDNLPAAIAGLYQGTRAGKLQVRFETAAEAGR